MSEVQQSPLYAEFIKSLNWKVITLNNIFIYIKVFPFYNTIAKIQRFDNLLDTTNLINLLKKNKVNIVAPEPDKNIDQIEFNTWCNKLSKNFRINKTPFLATKSIIIDLNIDEKNLFNNFTSAKQRAVRRAQKAGITIKSTQDIEKLIKVKNKSAGLFGSITTTGIKNLWNKFHENNADILLAYMDQKIVAGVLLIYFNKTAYYWLAGSLKEGKKQFAPTLLVWHCLLQAKQRNMKIFDFVGIWDERNPNKNLSWQGFTKFKEGFGGKNIYYPIFL